MRLIRQAHTPHHAASAAEAESPHPALSAMPQDTMPARAAFVVYDELQRRVWAARDRDGAQACPGSGFC